MKLTFTENDRDILVKEIECYINQCPSISERIEYRRELESLIIKPFKAFCDSGVFHDAIGKVVRVYAKDMGGWGTQAVDVETEY